MNNLKFYSASEIIFRKLSWKDLFGNEETLIKIMIEVAPKFEKNGYKGYTYVNSFYKQYESKGELFPKQITQLKRMSKEIYKCYFGY